MRSKDQIAICIYSQQLIYFSSEEWGSPTLSRAKNLDTGQSKGGISNVLTSGVDGVERETIIMPTIDEVSFDFVALTITYLGAAHNCYGNDEHNIARGAGPSKTDQGKDNQGQYGYNDREYKVER